MPVPAVKDQKRDAFGERHADWGTDLMLYLGWRVCGLKPAERAPALGGRIDAVVATNAQGFERRRAMGRGDLDRRKRWNQWLNCKI